MRTWWTRLTSSPRALAVAGGLVVLALVVGAVVTLGGSDDGPDSAPAAAATSSPEAEQQPGDESEAEDPEAPPSPLPPDRDAYCPAYAQIREGGLTTPGTDEDEQIDLGELSRTFVQLIERYETAARVAPQELRDDYARALDYLRQGRRATQSQDVELLKALVVNLESLDDSMSAIQSASARYCR